MEAITELPDTQAEYETLLSFMYMCPVGILRMDAGGNIDMMNPLAAQLLMPIATSAGIDNLFDVLEDAAPDLRNMVQAFPKLRGAICENQRLYLGQRGDEINVLSCTLLKVNVDCVMVVLGDLSRQVSLERRIKQTDSWLAAIYSGVNDFAFFSLDCQGRIDTWNQSGVRHTGYGDTEALGRALHLFYHPEDNLPERAAEHIQCARQDGWHLEESWCSTRDGHRYWGQILVAALTEDNGEINGYSVVLRDISERKLSGEKLKSLITTDHLTGATSRAHFFDVAEAEVARWKRYHRALSVIMIDVDFFKAINDTFGHLTGDRVLQMLVRHCRILLRSVDVVARLGGEEFAILLPSTDEIAAIEVAERIRQAVQDLRFETATGDAEFTVSLGCATMGGEIEDVTGLLGAADDALYRAKKAGRNRCVAYSDH